VTNMPSTARADTSGEHEGRSGDRWSRIHHVVILMLAPFASGAEHQTVALCRYLQERCRVTLLTNDEFAGLLRGDLFLRRYTAGLEIVPLGPAFPAARAATPSGALHRALLYPSLQVRVWRFLRQIQPDVVHLVLAPSFFAYAPLFHLLRLPTVMTLAGEMRYVRRFYGAGKRFAVRYALSRANSLVVCSADELENLRAVAPEQIAKASVLDNFTDVARFTPGQKDARLVTFAARLHPEKGARLFLHAASQVRATHPMARFALLGRGELEQAVDREIAELGLTDSVDRGFVTDLAPHLAQSTVFVSCQLYENLGSSSLLEAMASGNAIVATDVGQTWRIVDDDVGLRVEPRAEALAAGIRRLLDDPEGTVVRGVAARERVLARYGPEIYLRDLLAVYERVVDGLPR
jgi:glycosyltransferase involved in cell wall biosynthesis